MADHPGEPSLMAVISKITPFLPGVAGAIMAAAHGEKLKWHGKLLNFGLGLASAFLGAPVIMDIGRPIAPAFFPASMATLLGFVCGYFGMAAFSGFYVAVAKYTRDPLKIIKVQLGPVSIGDTSGET